MVVLLGKTKLLRPLAGKLITEPRRSGSATRRATRLGERGSRHLNSA